MCEDNQTCNQLLDCEKDAIINQCKELVTQWLEAKECLDGTGTSSEALRLLLMSEIDPLFKLLETK